MEVEEEGIILDKAPSKMRDHVRTEIVEAVGCVEKIRSVIDEAPDDLNGVEAQVVSQALESFVNKFKLHVKSLGCESMVGSKSVAIGYCNSLITALESRVDRLNYVQ